MRPYAEDPGLVIYRGDAREVLRELPSASADAVVTSPPYLDQRREYGHPSASDYEEIMAELRRVARGPLLLNVGRVWRDGAERLWWADLLGSAERAGYRLLDTLVWAKPNANPIHGAVLANSHEYVFMLGDDPAEFNPDAVRTPYAEASVGRMGRRWVNGRGVKGSVRGHQESRPLHALGARPRSVVSIFVGREKGNEHPAPMALELAEHLVALASREGQTVLDPFLGSGSTAVAARKLGRRCVGVELSPDYCALAAGRTGQLVLGTAPC